MSESPAAELGLKTVPFPYQLDYLRDHAMAESHGLWWEQGTGKTKAMIDNAALLWRAERIEGVIVVAPPGVERNWLTDELPAHLPDDMARAGRIMLWRHVKHQTIAHKRELAELLAHAGPIWLLIKYQSMMTKAGADAVWRVMQKCGARQRPKKMARLLMICDESAHDGGIKTPSSATSQRVKNAGAYAAYRRCADGTPVAESPFDAYAQVRFLRPSHWRECHLSPFIVFKTHFGIWRPGTEVFRPSKTQKGKMELVQYADAPLGYRNLDELTTHLMGTGSRLEKADVLKHLPPKLYQKHRFELSAQGRKLYDQLREEFTIELMGKELDAELSIVRLLRLQQITCGYLPLGDEGELVDIPGGNPRLEACEELLPRIRGQTLWWYRFLGDGDQLERLLPKGRTARYDGTRNDEQCARAKEAFQAGDLDNLLLSLPKGHAGLTLHAAETCVYYSNSFRLRHRLQSEDRPHRAGMPDRPVNYIDLVAEETVDEKIVASLRHKFDISTKLTGSRLREWL